MLRPLFGKTVPRKLSTTVATIALSLVVVAIGGSQRLGAQSVVFDPSNYSQNVLTAARTLNQINNQIKSLENQAQMLINGARNLTRLPTSVVGQLTAHINAINSLIAQAEGLSFSVQKTNADFARLYPRQYTAATSSNQMVQDATARWDNTYQALKQTLLTQATIASSLDQDGQTLRTLMANSSGAVGSLQAQQSGNELLALQVKQSLQAQALVVTQARADALRAVEQQASAEAGRARFARFIGDGHAYSGGR
jgi:type IV secretion system protein TrbJ